MILIAPDKFKGTMSAETAAHCIASTLSLYGYESIKFPMADGGEGTAMILAHIYGLQPESCVPKCYVKSDGTVGVMEAGVLTYGNTRSRDIVMDKDSAELGEALRLVMGKYPQMHTLYLGIGGTGTCDGGAGMLRVLRQYGLETRASQCLVGLCDVRVPLVAPIGEPSALMFAPQKGALPEDLPLLAERLRKWQEHRPGRSSVYDGAGGGLGFALASVLGARCVDGAAYFAEAIPWERGIDLIVSGEGRIDEQTSRGKVVDTLRRLAAAHGVPFLAFGGCVTTASSWALSCTDDASISQGQVPSPEQAVQLLKTCVSNHINLIRQMINGNAGC